jgi:DNA polymerase III subunit gamma/tau
VSTEVLYRKWRPERFADVTGQEHVTRTLVNAITLNRVGHAYLFAGPRGTGKTTVARIFGKAINCEKPVEGEACNECEPCKAFASGAFDFIEIDAASNRGVDDADRLRKQVNYAPSVGRYRIYLVDEVHMLSKQAFNALLKTLEEPPGHVVFILATTEAHDVLPTVTSRCQRFDFRRHTTGDVVERLAYICKEEGYELDEQSLSIMARAATGSLRDAINLLEPRAAAVAGAGAGRAGDGGRRARLPACAAALREGPGRLAGHDHGCGRRGRRAEALPARHQGGPAFDADGRQRRLGQPRPGQGADGAGDRDRGAGRV